MKITRRATPVILVKAAMVWALGPLYEISKRDLATEEIDADNGGAHYTKMRLLSYEYVPLTTEGAPESREKVINV
jgi:hypothetical protein